MVGRFGWRAMRRARLAVVFILSCSVLGISQSSAYLGPTVAGTITGQFEVTPTGAASYSIPISVPPGTAGMEPKLALRYSSQGGNGLLGVGWMMAGLSSLTRCPATLAQDGFIDPVDFDANDRLCLDGQRLKSVAGVHGGTGTEYRTELESFSKITATGSINAAASSFEVRTKAGLIYTYGDPSGVSGASFIAPGRSEVYVWAVKEIRDTVGNYLSVFYQRDPTTLEHYVDRIEYTGNLSAGLQPYNRVQFVYDLARPDVAERYLAGGSSRIQSRRRLTAIQTYTGTQLVREYRIDYGVGAASQRSRITAITECASNATGTQCLPPTTFAWQEKQPGTATDAAFRPPADLTHDDGYFESEAIDLNGDGRVDWIQAYYHDGYFYSNTWINSSAGWVLDPNWRLPVGIYSERHSLGEFADINGDGLPDFVYGRAGNNKTYINTGVGWSSAPDPKYQLPLSLYSGGNHRLGRLIDLNGDGLVDFVYSYYTTNRAFLNQPPGSCAASCWLETSAYALKVSLTNDDNEPLSDLADITGDGLPDHLIAVDNGGGNWSIATWVNTGSGWVRDSRLDLPEPLFRETDSKIRVGEIADVNGDGLGDFVVAYRAYDYCGTRCVSISDFARTYINTGQGWVVDATYQLPKSLHALLNGDAGGRVGMLADLNGDGLQDLVVSKEGYTRQLYIATQDPCTTTSCRWKLDSTQAPPFNIFTDPEITGTLTDLNADGLMDYALAHSGSRHAYISRGKSPDLLSAVTNGLGASITLEHAALSQAGLYTRGSAPAYPQQAAAAALTVTSSHAASDGLGGSRTLSYRYADMQVNLQGRGLLGFGSVTATDQVSGISETTQYRLDFPYTGMTLAASSRDSTGRTLKSLSNTLSLAQASCGGYGTPFPFVSSSRQRDYELTGYGSYVARNQTTDYQYDGCGNALRVTVASHKGEFTEDRHVSDTVNTYSGNTANWILGRLSRSEVTHTLPGGGSGKRVSSFTYHASTGLLTSETVEPGTSLALTTSYGYDVFGNKTAVTVGAGSSAPRTTTTVYDGYGRFPQTVTNALGHAETHSYDPAHGGRTRLTGPNGLSTTWQYDPFGRPILETRPDGTTVTTSYLFCGSLCVSGGAMAIRKQGSDGSDALVTLDLLEREIGTRKRAFDGGWIQTLTEYDAQGRKARISTPHYPGDTAYWTRYSYDVLDRVVQQESAQDQYRPSGRITRFAYAGLITTQTDPNGNSTTKEVNAAGRTVKVTDALGNSTQYGYDAFGNLTAVTDAAGNTSQMSYDLRGRKVSMNDPDMGVWYYSYNLYGELTSQTDAKNQTVNLQYDRLGRLVQRNEPEGVTTWTYDTRWKGALSSVVGPGGYEESIEYDSLGRPTRNRRVLDGQVFLTDTAYDSFSRPLQLTYPNNFKLKHVYNAYGYLSEIRQASDNALYWKLDRMDALGNIEMETLGNGVSSTRAHDPARGHLDAIITGKNGGSAVQSLSYQWDAVGNLLSRTDQNQGGLRETFIYDRLNRMTESRRAGQSNLTLQYDAIGNIIYKSDVGQYSYLGRPHAVAATTGPRSSAYGYDANGNMTYDNGRALEWTSYNLPKRVTQYTTVKVSSPLKPALSLLGYDDTTFYVFDSPDPGPIPSGVVNTMYAPATDVDGMFRIRWSDPGPPPDPTNLCNRDTTTFVEISTKQDFSETRVIFSSRTARDYLVSGLKPGTYFFRVYTVYSYYGLFLCTRNGESERGRDYIGPNIVTVGANFSSRGVSSLPLPKLDLGLVSLPGNQANQQFFNQSEFFYGPDRARYKQVVTRGSPPDSKIVYYVGELYEEHVYGSARIRKCFIRVGNRVIAIRSSYNDGSNAIEYLHRDHLNSVDVLTDATGAVLERTSFDAFGKRRPGNWTADPNDVYTNERLYRTARGYTGHEHLDNVGLIHMNGRVYDPALGRFTSPDPFVQFPESTQGLNRYSYVNNNPLSYTDPSGYFLEEILIAIAMIVIGEAADIPILTQIGFALLPGNPFLNGFAGGLISSDGDVRQAFVSGLTAGAFHAVGTSFGPVEAFSKQHLGKIIAHGIVGGVSSELSGGSFKEGFLSAGVTQAFAPAIDGLDRNNPGQSPVRVIAAAVVGGTAAELGGGKFANGAVTAAFSRAFNDDRHATLNTRESCPGECTLIRNARDGTAYWVPKGVAGEALAAAETGTSMLKPATAEESLNAVGTLAGLGSGASLLFGGMRLATSLGVVSTGANVAAAAANPSFENVGPLMLDVGTGILFSGSHPVLQGAMSLYSTGTGAIIQYNARQECSAPYLC
ncbi:MAG TPA: FG-GAP-like repeat-containing protein [Nevskiales bacterium]|nr:FG-GAP-like repeat-containing protein [Nevskiales bacterium]